jgi:hypothetical protein
VLPPRHSARQFSPIGQAEITTCFGLDPSSRSHTMWLPPYAQTLSTPLTTLPAVLCTF